MKSRVSVGFVPFLLAAAACSSGDAGATEPPGSDPGLVVTLEDGKLEGDLVGGVRQ